MNNVRTQLLAGLVLALALFPRITQAEEKADAAAAQEAEQKWPELPEAITSFGAAVTRDWVYVYGGHIGAAHTHTSKNLSHTFCRLNLKHPTAWERLPMGPPVQGLGMVVWHDKVYRIGGMQARNLPEEEGDLHSLSSVARYDPQAGKWEPMPDLPVPRSSHDAVLLGNKVLVVGGWNLQGGSANAHWFDDVLSLDLAAEHPKWETLAKTPFHRRALGAAACNGKLYVLGGIAQDGALSQQLDILDLATGKWSVGPEIPKADNKGNGFGIATYAVDGSVYASGMDGIVYRLSADNQRWEQVATLATPRFFHRLLPVRPGVLAAIAGAGWGTGHLKSTELIELPKAK